MMEANKFSLLLVQLVIGERAGEGGRRAAALQFQKFFKIFGQNADDSDKSIRKKSF